MSPRSRNLFSGLALPGLALLIPAGVVSAQAGIVAGDIILSVDRTSTHRFRKIARYFGSESIGRKAELRVIRSGTVITVKTTIAERTSGGIVALK